MPRVALLVFLVLLSPLARSDLVFPSVPAGGRLHATFTLSPPAGGIDIALSVADGCGNFDGSSSTSVVTDASGTASFDFTGGARTAQCIITGSHGNVSVQGQVTVYRPEDVAFERFGSVSRVTINSPAQVTAFVRAAGLPLDGVPVTVDALPATGASAALTSPASALTASNGQVSFTLRTNGTAGIYDVLMHAVNASARFRMVQLTAYPDLSQPADVHSYNLYDDEGQPKGQVNVGPSGCAVGATYTPDDPANEALPPGVLDFPFGIVTATARGCGAIALANIVYPQPIPPGAQCVFATSTSSTSPGWTSVPCTIQGNRASFNLAEKGPFDLTDHSSDVITFKGGVVLPGTRPPQRPVPSVQDMWWAGIDQNGWGMSIVQARGSRALFGVIYAYDGQGNPRWWVQSAGSWDTAFNYDFTGRLYAPVGTPWYDFDPSVEWVGSHVGAMTLSFQDDSHGSADIVIDGVHMTKGVVRQPFGRGDASPVADAGGMWYGGDTQSGWGIAVLQQQGTLFSVWFTYDESNAPTWFVMPGGAWTSASTYEGRIYRTHGAPWLGQAYDASILKVTDVGAYRFTFSGGSASFDYSVGDTHGTLNLLRQL